MPTYLIDVTKGIIPVYAQLIGPAAKRVLKLALDTGATYTMVPYEAIIGIGCDPSLPRRKIEIFTASGREYLPVVTIPSIRCLGFQIQNLDVVCHDLPPQSPVDGLLGLNFMAHFNIFLKFLTHTLEISK